MHDQERLHAPGGHEEVMLQLESVSKQFATKALPKEASAHWRRGAQAPLLLWAPDMLLLDEPTNHLDEAAQRWFDDFLLKSSFTRLVISHDTAFLARIATHIWEIRHQRIMESVGNCTEYVSWL